MTRALRSSRRGNQGPIILHRPLHGGAACSLLGSKPIETDTDNLPSDSWRWCQKCLSVIERLKQSREEVFPGGT